MHFMYAQMRMTLMWDIRPDLNVRYHIQTFITNFLLSKLTNPVYRRRCEIEAYFFTESIFLRSPVYIPFERQDYPEDLYQLAQELKDKLLSVEHYTLAKWEKVHRE